VAFYGPSMEKGKCSLKGKGSLNFVNYPRPQWNPFMFLSG